MAREKQNSAVVVMVEFREFCHKNKTTAVSDIKSEMYLLSEWVAFSVQVCVVASSFTLDRTHTSQGPSVAGVMEVVEWNVCSSWSRV